MRGKNVFKQDKKSSCFLLNTLRSRWPGWLRTFVAILFKVFHYDKYIRVIALFKAAFMLRKSFHIEEAKNYDVSGCAVSAQRTDDLLSPGLRWANVPAWTYAVCSSNDTQKRSITIFIKNAELSDVQMVLNANGLNYNIHSIDGHGL